MSFMRPRFPGSGPAVGVRDGAEACYFACSTAMDNCVLLATLLHIMAHEPHARCAHGVAVLVHNATLPPRIRKHLAGSLHKPEASIRDDQPHASKAPILQVFREAKPAGLFGDRTVPSRFNRGIGLDTVGGETRVPHRASVMSSTPLTDTPARYISIRASSTELSRRRYRSILRSQMFCYRSFGILRVTSPACVVSLRR
jgi:hypothetical protein